MAGPHHADLIQSCRQLNSLLLSFAASTMATSGKMAACWGRRVSKDARHAIGLAGNLDLWTRELRPRRAIDRHFRTDLSSHCFHVEPHEWLRLSEVQSTKALAHFLNAGGDSRATAFLRALAPQFPWPADLRGLRATAEVPADDGRIDLLIEGRAQGRSWGAVVEAKFGHNLKTNPLPSYRKTAEERGLYAGNSETATAVFKVVGISSCNITARRLASNKAWAFVGWDLLLRRYEVELGDTDNDQEFRRFRRTLWKRGCNG